MIRHESKKKKIEKKHVSKVEPIKNRLNILNLCEINFAAASKIWLLRWSDMSQKSKKGGEKVKKYMQKSNSTYEI